MKECEFVTNERYKAGTSESVSLQDIFKKTPQIFNNIFNKTFLLSRKDLII